MELYQEQIDRIKNKLEAAKDADPELYVFGAENHRYRLAAPAKDKTIRAFEERYAVSLPDSFKAFLLQLGNGGPSYRNAGAGPDYGIYPLGTGVDDLVYEHAERYLQNPCVLFPDMSDEHWKELNALIDSDDISDEEYDDERGKIFGGILPVGTQGCTYYNGIVLNGAYKGRMIYLDETLQKPHFAPEAHFLDWYEAWLDRVIAKTAMTIPPRRKPSEKPAEPDKKWYQFWK